MIYLKNLGKDYKEMESGKEVDSIMDQIAFIEKCEGD